MIETHPMGIADRLFEFDEDGNPKYETAEFEMIALLQKAAVPFNRIGWDYYDGSLEIYGVPSEWRMDADLQRTLWDEGFSKVYVNHIGVEHWETHYSFGREFESSSGWRVSYPHKRDDGSKQIWVEERVRSWPRKWFRSFLWRKPYVLIKRVIK
jgi:hypothetical protein